MTEQLVLDSIRKVAHETLPKGASLLLYGSRARGDAHEGSDWDLLILLDKEKVEEDDYDTIAYPFTYKGWEMNESIIPLIYTKVDWQRHASAPFQQNVERDKIKIA